MLLLIYVLIFQFNFFSTDLIGFFKTLEDTRLKWLVSERESASLESRVKKLESENKRLEDQLNSTRYALGREVQMRERAQKERDRYLKQLQLIRKFVIEETNEQQGNPTREKVLSYLNLNRFEPVLETIESTDDSLNNDSDIAFMDQSLENSIEKSSKSTKRKNSSPADGLALNKTRKSGINATVETAEEAMEEDSSTEEKDKIDEQKLIAELASRKARLNRVGSDRLLPYQTSSTPQLSPIRQVTPGELSRMYHSSRLENRPHTFTQKKSFKAEMCGPCEKKIGFMANCYRCQDCRAICHTECRDKVPLPCIPYATPTSSHRQGGRLLLVADFAPQSSPMVPALIVHCCNEIEKRGLSEVGLYRVSGSEAQVCGLKDKILKSKSGMPNLVQYDVHVLCGVVKKFLMSLDEPLITRILWRDFVRAAGTLLDNFSR